MQWEVKSCRCTGSLGASLPRLQDRLLSDYQRNPSKPPAPAQPKRAGPPARDSCPAFRATFYGAQLHQPIRLREPSTRTDEVRRSGTVTLTHPKKLPIAAMRMSRTTTTIGTRTMF